MPEYDSALPYYAYWMGPNTPGRYCGNLYHRSEIETMTYDYSGWNVVLLPTPTHEFWAAAISLWENGYVCRWEPNKKYTAEAPPPRLRNQTCG